MRTAVATAILGTACVSCLSLEPASEADVDSALARGGALERETNLAEAIEEYETARELARDLRDAPLLLARASNRLGALHHRLGDLDRAASFSEEALSAATRAASEPERAEALFTLAYVQYSLGRFPEAIRLFEESSAVAAAAGDRALLLRAELLVGMTASMMEQSERAFASLENAIRLARELGDRASEAEGARLAGQVHSRMGETQKALERYEEALRLLEPFGDVAEKGPLLNALGQVYFDMGESETALRHYELALALHQRLQLKRREGATLLEIGRCHLELGREEEAASRFREALEIFRELDNQRLEADALGELGRLHQRRGEAELALRYFEEAVLLKEEVDDPRGRAYSLNDAGILHLQLSRYEEALACFREAAELSRLAGDPLGESLALYQMARVHRERGALEAARTEVERSLDLVETLRARLASHDLRTSFLAAVHERHAFYVDLLMRLHRGSPSAGFDGLAFEASERARARTLVESLSEAAAGIREGIEPALLEEERALRARLNAAARERLSSMEPDAAEELERDIELLASEHDRLQSRIRVRSPRYAELTAPASMSLAETKSSALDEETLLLSVGLGPERSFLFSVTSESHSVYELPPGHELEELAREAHRDLRSPRDSTASSAVRTLSSILLDPVEGLFDRRRLAVVADGALSHLPFGALSTPGDPETPLVSSFEIVRLPSASILPVLRAQRKGRGFERLAAVAADPVYGRRDARVAKPHRFANGVELELPRLAASRREAMGIAELAPEGSVEVVTGFEASREWVETTDFRPFRIVHFAAHGLVDDERPELSGIVLSLLGPSGEPRDGLLRLHDVYNLELPVDLVVLSACETGLGKEVRGEGLVGLVRGFMYAGAPAVIASAWKVDDEATTELMKHFYRAVFAGDRPAQALRKAQIATWNSGRFQAPYYWAAFELQGDWE